MSYGVSASRRQTSTEDVGAVCKCYVSEILARSDLQRNMGFGGSQREMRDRRTPGPKNWILPWNRRRLQQFVTSFDIFYEQIYIFQGTGVCKKKACRPICLVSHCLPPHPQFQCWLKYLNHDFTWTGFFFARPLHSLKITSVNIEIGCGGSAMAAFLGNRLFFLQTPESDFYLWHDFENFSLQFWGVHAAWSFPALQRACGQTGHPSPVPPACRNSIRQL